MQICFLFVTFCQCVVSLVILALMLWPRPLRLNSVLAPRTSDPAPSTRPEIDDVPTDDLGETTTIVTTVGATMVIHEQKLEVGWRSLICAAPAIEDSLRNRKFDEKLTGFDANKNHSLDKFPNTKFALTCLAIEQHKNECVCFAPLWLSMLALAAAVSSMIFVVQFFVFCIMGFRESDSTLLLCNWGSIFSFVAAISWIGIGRLFNAKVVEKWPFKFSSETGVVEDYYIFPPTWYAAHMLCYAFLVLLILQLCTFVCDVMVLESNASAPTSGSSSNRKSASSSASSINCSSRDDRCGRNNTNGRRSMVVVFQSNLTQLCRSQCRSGAKTRKKQAQQPPSAMTTSTATAPTLEAPSIRSKVPAEVKREIPAEHQPQPGAAAEIAQQQQRRQQLRLPAAPKIQVKHIPVNFPQQRKHWRALHSQKSLTVPSVQSIAAVDGNDPNSPEPKQPMNSIAMKNVLLPSISSQSVKDVQQPFWLGQPRIGQQMHPTPSVANNCHVVPKSKK